MNFISPLIDKMVFFLFLSLLLYFTNTVHILTKMFNLHFVMVCICLAQGVALLGGVALLE